MHPIQLFIHVAGLSYAPKNWNIAPINTQRLYIILDGKGTWLDRNDCPKSFLSGHLYIFPLNFDPHFTSDPDERLEHLFFDFQSSPPLFADEPLVFKIDSHPELKLLTDYVTAKLRTISQVDIRNRFHIDPPNVCEPMYRDMSLELMRMLELLLLQCDEITELPFSRDTVISDAILKIHRDYTNRLSVKQLAADAGFVPAHFIRRLEKATGQTPYAYIRSLKLDRARELMSNGFTLAQAAIEVGYESASSLSHALARSKP